MDSESNRIGTRAYSFLVTPMTGPALRFSGVVIADRCMAENDHEGRSNLLDPMILDGCLLAPAASGSFSPDSSLTIFVRLYPSDEKIGILITKHWKAYAVLESGRVVPLAIKDGGVRGLVASGKLMLGELNLKSGTHPIRVVFEVQRDDGRKHPIALNSEFSITP